MEAKDYIDEIRSSSQLTQAEISERTGIPQPTISKIERGEVKDVMSRNYRALQELHKDLGLADKSVVSATAPVTTDPVLAADFVKAEQAGYVKLSKPIKPVEVWDGKERRSEVRRADDRARDAELEALRAAGQGA